MPEIVFEVSTISPILCSYPGCGRINGKVRQAKWLIRVVGSNQEPHPVCFSCKARLKTYLAAGEVKRMDGDR
jgi:hypothetical protein